MSADQTRDVQPVYLYGVVPAAGDLSLPEAGVAGAEIELVEHDGLAALVSAFPADDARVRRRDLDAHLRTIESVFEHVTIAPCPFGTVMRSRGDVEDRLLAPRREELRRLLAGLEGHVQMNLKAEYDQHEMLSRIVADDREVAAASERARKMGSAAYYENIRLGELVSARLAAARAGDAKRIESRLSPLAADVAPDAVDGAELLVFKGAFLVARDNLETFDAALEELAAAEGERLRFEEIGPLPPAAFATLEPGDPAWA
jgi:gas vesicle protein GvpL/GvpF